MFYYYKVRGFAPVAVVAAADSARVADSLRRADSARVADSLRLADSLAAAATPADTAPRDTARLGGQSAPAATDTAQPAPAPVKTAAEPVTASCDPGPGYNLDHSCFDQRPKPLSATFIDIPAGVARTPRASVLWIQVSAEGKTLDVRPSRPSNNLRFERTARKLAWTLSWQPARKDGAPVVGWTQWIFRPN